MVLASPGHAQILGTAERFGVLAGSTVTNTGPSVISGTAARPGDVGVSPGNAIVGFPPGIVVPPGAFHAGDAVAAQAQVDLITAYNTLAGMPPQVNLTGQNLGGLVLPPAVYSFATSAQLTGALTLNGLGNSAAQWVFQIGSTLTTASNSSVLLINGAQGTNVYWQVGSSATLGTNTSFTGNIVTLESITLNTGATISCGSALARNGAVTLDNNTITLCDAAAAPVTPLEPTGFPLFVGLLPSTATPNQIAVAQALDNFFASGATIPLELLNLFNLSPEALASALSQLSGETGTGIAQTGSQAMDSFLSLVTNPFGNNRPFDRSGPPMVVKTRGYAPEGPQSFGHAAFAFLNRGPFAGLSESRRWSTWTAAYGGQGNANGDPSFGSHDRLGRTFGLAVGADYLVTPYTLVGVAIGGGATKYGLSEGLGGGRSEMFQSALYSLTWINSFYVSTAAAFAWHRVSTDRTVTVLGSDHLTAVFSATNFGGRIEGGYRFAIPGVNGWPAFGVTPYAALQGQSFHMPSYSEDVASGSSLFALAYSSRTTTAVRTEVGAWLDRTIAVDDRTILALRTRAAWVHDHRSDPSIVAAFQSLPGSSFTVFGVAPAEDFLLASAVAEVSFRNGISLAGKFDSEISRHAQTYAGTGRLRYTW